MANLAGVKVILNPAPACKLPTTLLKNVWIITPNEKEAEMLTGIPIVDDASIANAADLLLKKGVKAVIITLGSKRAYIATKEIKEFISAPVVTAVDTTAAGDVFNGALAVAFSENMTLIDAVNFACHIAAIAVTKMGAQASAPFRDEVESFILSK